MDFLFYRETQLTRLGRMNTVKKARATIRTTRK